MKKQVIFSILLIMVFGTISIQCTRQVEESIRLLPAGFTGSVFIIFNQADGVPKEYEGNKRVYRIPKSGVLKTQFKTKGGSKSIAAFYEDSNGKRSVLPVTIFSQYDRFSSNRVVWVEGAISGTAKNRPNYKKFISCMVGKVKDIDSIRLVRDTMVIRVIHGH